MKRWLAVWFYLAAAGVWLAACQTISPRIQPSATAVSPTATITLPTATPAAQTPVGFEQFLAGAQAQQLSQRPATVNGYMAQVEQAPLIGPETAVILYRGPGQRVQLLGDMNNWNPETAADLTRLEGTDLWYLVASFEPAARLDYLFLIDGSERRLDPLNPQLGPNPTGPRSVLVMPAYDDPLPVVGAPPRGVVSSHTLDSAALNETRTFFVYEPPGQVIGQPLPVLIMNNGSNFLTLLEMPRYLDALIAERILPPLLVVFVPPIDAAIEYALNDNYAVFLADELVPYLQGNFNVSGQAAETGIAGADLGALAAVQAAIRRPDVFGLLVGLSGPYAFGDGRLLDEIGDSAARLGLQKDAASEQRVFLAVGSYETGQTSQDRGPLDLVQAAESLETALIEGGRQIRLEQRPAGHSWGYWRDALIRGLIFLYG